MLEQLSGFSQVQKQFPQASGYLQDEIAKRRLAGPEKFSVAAFKRLEASGALELRQFPKSLLPLAEGIAKHWDRLPEEEFNRAGFNGNLGPRERAFFSHNHLDKGSLGRLLMDSTEREHDALAMFALKGFLDGRTNLGEALEALRRHWPKVLTIGQKDADTLVVGRIHSDETVKVIPRMAEALETHSATLKAIAQRLVFGFHDMVTP